MNSSAFREQILLPPDSIFLASCSVAPATKMLEDALSSMQRSMKTPELAWHDFEQETNQLRQSFAAYIGASASQIALMPNASTCAYQVVSTMTFSPGDEIVFSEAEFPSIAHVWHQQQHRGVKLVAVPQGENHQHTLDLFRQAITDRTRLVSVTHTCFRDGKTLPYQAITQLAKSAGAKVFIDGYQGFGVSDINVSQMECDFFVTGYMKYGLGLAGVAMLYVKDPSDISREPQLTGWFARKNPFAFDINTVDFAEDARKFETGTPATPAIYAARAGLSLLCQFDRQRVCDHIANLVHQCAQQLEAMGEHLVTRPVYQEHGAQLAVKTLQANDLSNFLSLNQVVVSPRGNAVRLSFHYFNNQGDIERVCQLIRLWRQRSGPD